MTGSLVFTTHHNWDWVICKAIKNHESREFSVTKVNRFKDLPSQVNDASTKATYSLMRVDGIITSPCTTVQHIIQVRLSSLSFAHLDPKDALFKDVRACGGQQHMPKTTLIEWDRESDVPLSDFPSHPALLKAALGSGGFGLYFVYNSHDIREVIKGHKARAERAVGFIDGLRRDYGDVPHWSLQQLVPSIRIQSKGNRRCQIRAYVVECNGRLYLYDTYEVRLPCWDIDLDVVLAEELSRSRQLAEQQQHNVVDNGDHAHHIEKRWTEDVENECCGSGNARPYNEKRNKTLTERHLISEIPELSGPEVRGAIHRAMTGCFRAIKENVLSHGSGRPTGSVQHPAASESDDTALSTIRILPSTMAVAGVDLLVSRSDGDSNCAGCDAFIVEINNNPAMPKEDKHMSDAYRRHLLDLADSILLLGMRAAVVDSDCDATDGRGEREAVADFMHRLDPGNVMENRFELL